MPIFKKFILNYWIKSFFTSLIVLLLLLSIGNLLSDLLRGNLSNSEVLLNFIIELPKFLTQIIPISCLVASLFSSNRLKESNELTAIFASGFSRMNYLFIIFQASFVISIFQFIISAYINPTVQSKKFDLLKESTSKFKNLNKQGLSSSTINSGRIWYRSKDYFFSFSKYNRILKELDNVSIYKFNQEKKIESIIHSKKLIYTGGENKWLAQNNLIYTNLSNSKFPISKSEDIKIELNEKIKDFKQIDADITTLTFFKLYAYITQLRKNGLSVGEYLVIFFKHLSEGLICIIFCLFGAVSIFNSNRRGSSFGKNASFIFIFTILYWLTQAYVIELGKNLKLDPFVACFIIPFFFTALTSFIFYKNRRLS